MGPDDPPLPDDPAPPDGPPRPDGPSRPDDPALPDEADSVGQLRAELEVERRRVATLEAENARLARGAKRPVAGPPGGRRSHRFWVAVLLVLGMVLTPISILALFVKNEITNTDRYVQTVKPLSSDPAIQAYVADDVSKELFARVDIPRYVREALPNRARPLAGPLTSALQGFVHEAVLRIIQTAQFQQLWVDANRVAHTQVVNVLTGKESGAVTATSNGAVTVDLSSVTKLVTERLQSTGIDLFSKIPIGGVGGKITVFQSQDLYKARNALGILDTLAFVLPFVVFGSFGGAIYLSRNRRRGFVEAAFAFTAGALLLAAVLAVGRGLYLDAATGKQLPYDAASAIYDTLVRFLLTSVRAVLSFSLIVLIAVFFAGPSRFAVWFRTQVGRTAVWLGGEADRAGWTWLSANAFVARYKSAFRIATAALAFLVLFRWKHPTPSSIFWVAAAVLAVLALIEFFGRAPAADSRPHPTA
jgi:hypothetical protein